MALPNYYSPYQGMYQPQQMQPQQTPIQTQQNNGFVPVPSEDVARNYPVALGMSVSFKDENAPYIYTKTMGLSPMNQPIFEKYKLIKEDDTPVKPSDAPRIDFDIERINNTIDDLKDEIDTIWGEIDALKPKKNNASKKKSGNGDD